MGWLKIFHKRRAEHEAPVVLLHFEVEREDDGRYLVEVMDLPGVMAYGETEQEAVRLTASLALRVIAERIENGETPVNRGLNFVLEPA